VARYRDGEGQEGQKIDVAGRLIISASPELTSPYLLVGCKGWLNAGEVSTGCIDFLRHSLSAHSLGYLEPRGYYIYQVPSSVPEQTLRPDTRIEDGVIKKLETPRNEFHYWRSGGRHDLILFSGLEPNLAWPDFAQAIIDVARRFRAPRIYTLGAVFDRVPHTRKTRTFAVVNQAYLKDELKHLTRFIDYEGPASFTTMLLWQARAQGTEAIALTARTPLYIQQYNAKTCYELLKLVLVLTHLDIDLSNLKLAGEALVDMTDRAFSENASAYEQLKKLEELFDSTLPDESQQAVAEDFETLLQEMENLKRNGRKPH